MLSLRFAVRAVTAIVVLSMALVTTNPIQSPPSASAAQARPLYYFALGDSIASGHGLKNGGGPFTTDNCRRSTLAYPYKVKDRLSDSFSTRLRHIACTGSVTARTSDTNTTTQLLSYQVDQALAEIATLPALTPVLVSMTIGANDFQFANLDNFNDKLDVFHEDEEHYRTWVNERSLTVRTNVRTELIRLLQYQNVRVVVSGVHNPFNPESAFFLPLFGCTNALGWCYTRIEYAVTMLNTALVSAVDDLEPGLRAQAAFAPVYADFSGREAPHDSCGSAGPDATNTLIQHKFDQQSEAFPTGPVDFIGRLIFLSLGGYGTWRGDCIHPNETGAHVYARNVANAAGPLLATVPDIPVPASMTPERKPFDLPARLPWADGWVHTITNGYNPDNSTDTDHVCWSGAQQDCYALDFNLGSGEAVYPVFGGTVVYAGCATGIYSSYGRVVYIERSHNGRTFGAIYAHLSSLGIGASRGQSIGANTSLGKAGATYTDGTGQCNATSGSARLHVAIYEGASFCFDVATCASIGPSGGKPVMPEPLMGSYAYQSFEWWRGGMQATNLTTGTSSVTGSWATDTADLQTIPYGTPIHIGLEVQDTVNIRAVHITAWYPDWAHDSWNPGISPASSDVYPESSKWRVLAVCAPGGGQGVTGGCSWSQVGTSSIYRRGRIDFTWTPTAEAGILPSLVSWQPRANPAINERTTTSVPLCLSFDVVSTNGTQRLAPGGVLGSGCSSGGSSVVLDPPVACPGSDRCMSKHWREPLLFDALEGYGDASVYWYDKFTPHGELSIDPVTGFATYSSYGAYVGPDTFTYSLLIGDQTVPVTVTVTSTNSAPAAPDLQFDTRWSQELAFDPLARASDSDGDPLYVTIIDPPEFGNYCYLHYSCSDGRIHYTRGGQFVGVDRFSYEVTDGANAVVVETTINITNAAPIATDVHLSMHWSSELSFDPLASVASPDGDALYVTVHPAPRHGSICLYHYSCSDGMIHYYPNHGFLGVETFTYEVSDGIQSDTVVVTIDVTNTAPDASAIMLSTHWSSHLSFDPLAGVANPDGDGLYMANPTAPSHGATCYWHYSCNDNLFHYWPSGDFLGLDTFQYEVWDGLEFDTIVVTINVTNTAPQVDDLNVTVHRNASLVIDAIGRAIDPDDSVSLSSASDPPHGTVQPVYNYTTNRYDLLYYPDGGYQGSDSFSYVVSDGIQTDSATVNVTVIDPNVAPVALAGDDQAVDDANGDGSEPVTLNAGGSSDADGSIVSWQWSENGQVIATGTTPTVWLSTGPHSLTLTLTDDDGAQSTDVVQITVRDVVAPTTTLTRSPNANYAGWNRGDVTLDFTATDNQGGSGVDRIVVNVKTAPVPAAQAATSKSSVIVSTEGQTTVTYFAKDESGNREARRSVIVKIDTTLPVVTAPTVSLRADALSQGNAFVDISWSGADVGIGSGLRKFVVQQSLNGGRTWKSLSAATLLTSLHVPVSPGQIYQFRVRAYDKAGNISDWETSQPVIVDALQELSSAIVYRYSGAWFVGSVSGASGGSVKYSAATGTSATITFTGTSVGWLTTTGPNRGIAEIWIDGILSGTVDLYSSTLQAGKFMQVVNGLASGTHTLEVRVTGSKHPSATGKRIDVDAFIVLN
jgi:murein DD-endopeptidase MepM/ murein hydrolase activator NlpD/lysophospholipase L1-like esterase